MSAGRQIVDWLNLKRVLDLVIACLLAIPAAIICTILLPAIWLDTRASPWFLQKRIGREKRPFTIVKLRTMRKDTPHLASHQLADPKLSRLGALLRRLKIDELPQIWNVLTGSMSFVGPRPCLPSQKKLIFERDRLGVYRIRPGITGPSQIAGIDMSTPVALAQCDATYLEQPSLMRDLGYMLTTVRGGGRGDAIRKQL